jgi:hypothetical protein
MTEPYRIYGLLGSPYSMKMAAFTLRRQVGRMAPGVYRMAASVA